MSMVEADLAIRQRDQFTTKSLPVEITLDSPESEKIINRAFEEYEKDKPEEYRDGRRPDEDPFYGAFLDIAEFLNKQAKFLEAKASGNPTAIAESKSELDAIQLKRLGRKEAERKMADGSIDKVGLRWRNVYNETDALFWEEVLGGADAKISDSKFVRAAADFLNNIKTQKFPETVLPKAA